MLQLPRRYVEFIVVSNVTFDDVDMRRWVMQWHSKSLVASVSPAERGTKQCHLRVTRQVGCAFARFNSPFAPLSLGHGQHWMDRLRRTRSGSMGRVIVMQRVALFSLQHCRASSSCCWKDNVTCSVHRRSSHCCLARDPPYAVQLQLEVVAQLSSRGTGNKQALAIRRWRTMSRSWW